MKTDINLYSLDFVSFSKRGLSTLMDDKPVDGGYSFYVAAFLASLFEGESARIIINLPPRHLKTIIGAILVAAYEIGRRPTSRVLIVSGSDELGQQSRDLLEILLTASWFGNAFGVKIISSNARGFRTSEGGTIRFVSIDGKFTGLGADLLIVDDPVDISDANNLERHQTVNARFDSKILSRLNTPATGRVVVISHRLSEHDLAGYLLASDTNWSHLKLAFEAPADETFLAGGVNFRRKRGELLRPNSVSPKQLAHMRKQMRPVSFETLYQQNPGGRGFDKLDPSSIGRDEGGRRGGGASGAPLVFSVDPARSTSDRSKYSVIQVWEPSKHSHVLLEQFRGRVEFGDLCRVLIRMCKIYMPSIVIIENNSNAAGLAEKIERAGFKVELIDVGRRSKLERLMPHIPLIRGGGILLGPNVDAERFISELIEFPSGDFDDQVDALTLFLDYVSTHNDIPPRRERALAAMGSMPDRTFTPGGSIYIFERQRRF